MKAKILFCQPDGHNSRIIWLKADRSHPVVGFNGGNFGNYTLNTSGQYPVLNGAMKNPVFFPKYPTTIFRLYKKCQI